MRKRIGEKPRKNREKGRGCKQKQSKKRELQKTEQEEKEFRASRKTERRNCILLAAPEFFAATISMESSTAISKSPPLKREL